MLNRYTAIAVAGVVALTGCTASSQKRHDTESAPTCKPSSSGKASVMKLEHDAMMIAACFWCNLSEEERKHFTEETEKALANAVPGNVVRIESPQRKDVYMVLNIEKVQVVSGNNHCVDYEEIVHFDNKEIKYPKKVCFQDTEEAGE
jgi:surface antigen